MTALPPAVATAQQGVTFTISAPKTVFYLGETIPLQLAFASTLPETYLADSRLYDRIGRLNGAEVFKVDPADGVEDPLRDLLGEDGLLGGESLSPVTLSAKPCSFERILNEWVRFTRPDTYQVTVVSHRVRPNTEPYRGSFELTSNVLTIEIRPAPAGWVEEQIAAAVKILDGSATGEERQSAYRTLRFLDTFEAAKAAVLHLAEDSYEVQAGVLGSPYRRYLLPLLEQRLEAADQPVFHTHLYTLARLSELVESGGPMPLQPNHEDQLSIWTARLAAATPGKQPGPSAVSLVTLLDTVLQEKPEPKWLHSIVELAIREFRTLPPETQRSLLENRWSLLKSPAMLPILRDLYAVPSDPDLAPLVVRRLADLAQEEGRRILLDEIRRPDSALPFELLASLPDRTLPELDESLAAGMEAEEVDDMLLVRYATGAIVKRVEKAYELRAEQCATPLVFYFLKYDPEYGERELRRSLAAEDGSPSCENAGFAIPGPWAMSPALERLAIEMLSSASAPIKNSAAGLLGEYGSAAAQEPLWKTMESCAADRTGDSCEEGTITALAQGNAWLLREPGLKRLQSLCSSDACRQEVAAWLQMAKSPVRVVVSTAGEYPDLLLAQYRVGSQDELAHRLAQFPPKTEFRLECYGSDSACENIRRTIGAAGHVVLSDR